MPCCLERLNMASYATGATYVSSESHKSQHIMSPKKFMIWFWRKQVARKCICCVFALSALGQCGSQCISWRFASAEYFILAPLSVLISAAVSHCQPAVSERRPLAPLPGRRPYKMLEPMHNP